MRGLAGGAFVANDVRLGGAERLLLLTGANMGGKSTLMRQLALSAVLAQLGSALPARRARLSLVDRVFTRLGASDRLAAGTLFCNLVLALALACMCMCRTEHVRGGAGGGGLRAAARDAPVAARAGRAGPRHGHARRPGDRGRRAAPPGAAHALPRPLLHAPPRARRAPPAPARPRPAPHGAILMLG